MWHGKARGEGVWLRNSVNGNSVQMEQREKTTHTQQNCRSQLEKGKENENYVGIFREEAKRSPAGAIIWGIVLPRLALRWVALSCCMPHATRLVSHLWCNCFMALRTEDTRTQSRAIIHAKLGSNNATMR